MIRCCDGFVSLSLIHSPHPSLFVSLSVSGLPRSAAKNKTIIRLHLNLSSVEFCSCVTLDDKGVESKCPSHYVFFFFILFVFVRMAVYVVIWLFYCPLIQHPEPCIFFFILMFVFVFPLRCCRGGRGGGYGVNSKRSRVVQRSDCGTK